MTNGTALILQLYRMFEHEYLADHSHLQLEEDEPIGGDHEREWEQVEHETVGHQQDPLDHKRPVDHLVHEPRGLTGF